MSDPQRLNPPLLPTRQRDEKAQLHQFGFGEVGVQLLPKVIVGNRCIPQNRARVAKRRLLAIVEPI